MFAVTYQLHHGDALAVLKTMPDNSVDAICTDPPSSIHFMGAAWDHDKGGRTQWVAWLAEIMRESLRVIRPGGHALVWALPRTAHWTATALEDAGWQVRDRLTHFYSDGGATAQAFMDSLTDEQRELLARATPDDSSIYHLTGQGFPKSLAVDKAIDRHLGADRETVGPKVYAGGHVQNHGGGKQGYHEWKGEGVYCDTAPATDAAKRYAGFGSSLKPAVENWLLCRKPLEGTIAQNVLAHSTGALNIAACRVGVNADDPNHRAPSIDFHKGGNQVYGDGLSGRPVENLNSQGRFPSHLLLSHHPACRLVGSKRVKGIRGGNSTNIGGYEWQGVDEDKRGVACGYADADGMEEVAEYVCDAQCPIRQLDEQAGVRKSGGSQHEHSTARQGIYGQYTAGRNVRREPDTGTVSRFFTVFPPEPFEPDPDALFRYEAKASRSDRSSNGAVNNTHPCTKSVALGKWLTRLIAPPGGTVLDCFCGSGSLGVAAILEGFNWIGVDENESYIAIARARLEWAEAQRPAAEQLAMAV